MSEEENAATMAAIAELLRKLKAALDADPRPRSGFVPHQQTANG